ncbi:hypothetical protein WG906_14030 [Pedobacter sp. P351]|uniref:DUF922 domain-containing protein n=1 Tax=Pedobacter superstes TaxID=3133441 RepID=UPI0030B6FAB2
MKGDTAATTSSEVKVLPMKVNIWNGKVTYTAVAQFLSHISYYYPQRADDYTLEHEQLHFDITELFARKIRKVIQQKGPMFPRDAQKLFTIYLEELEAWQDTFDNETEHGIKTEEQLRWKILLSNQLKEFEN